jgi:4-aminobutyrate aminotransferase
MTQTTQDAKALVPGFVAHMSTITVERGEGSWVYATDGSKWLDFVMGIAVLNTGHCHPKVVAAVREQAGKAIHLQMNEYYHQPMLDLTERLLPLVPGDMHQILYANSGAEAVENAVKLAKGTLRRPGVIGFHNAFHGRTHVGMALTSSQVHYRGHMQPLLPCVFGSRYCDPYHTPAGLDPTEYALEDLRRILRTEIYGEDVACIIVEPLQGEGGFIVPTPEFFRELRAICDEIGAYLVIDEIQAGMGRTGKWFCHEHYGVTADIVTMAKAIASGVPLAAIVSRKEIWDKVVAGSMGGTYGGNVVACAAALATIEAIEEEDMLANAARQGEKLRAFWAEKQKQYPCIGDVRGKGLMDGIELVKPGTREPAPDTAKAFIAAALKRNVILMGAGTMGNCVRFLPALNITDADMDTALAVFDEAAKEAFVA